MRRGRPATISGFVGRLERFEDNLLIGKGLMAKFQDREGERLLNLKDLISVFLPSLRRQFENETRSEGSFLCRIAPNSAIFRQKRADNGRKCGFLATDFGGWPSKIVWRWLILAGVSRRCLLRRASSPELERRWETSPRQQTEKVRRMLLAPNGQKRVAQAARSC